MKNFEKVKAASIAHYNRMIAWAETQPQTDPPSIMKMYRAINEHWKGDSCPMCIAISSDCNKCPIAKTAQTIGCRNTPWHTMNASQTWKDWLFHARRELEFITALKNI